jgi:trigger factor
MQVTETLAQGLKREYRVVVPLGDLDAKVNERLTELKERVRINGFRPGKVPVAHLKRIYGRAVMAETIDQIVREANATIISDSGFRLALEPKVVIPETEAAMVDLLAGKADLAYSVELEILPKFELADFKDIRLEKPVAAVTPEAVTQAIEGMAKQNQPFAGKGESAKAEPGDQATISFAGTVDGEPFEGGTAQEFALVLGSQSFLPGFEDQLLGIAAGESRTVKITFPSTYTPATLAGKEAVFSVSAQKIEAPQAVSLDDDFAKTLGVASLDALRSAVRDRLDREHAAASRLRLKRALLDALDERHNFELPPSLVEREFENVWQALRGELEADGKTFADEGRSEEAERAEYTKIAERRVRLGLVLAEIGERNAIKVTDDEMARAIIDRARQFPKQEQQVWDYYRKNPNAAAALRAPIYEEKVVDFLLELVTVTEREVAAEELYKDPEPPRAPG